jgi:hypothetical protein
VFRFPALAALAGRRPLGGEREVALAAFICAHLVVGTLSDTALPAEMRARRAAGARAWLAAIALPGPARTPFARLIDASGQEDPAATRQALRSSLQEGACRAAAGRSFDPSRPLPLPPF